MAHRQHQRHHRWQETETRPVGARRNRLSPNTVLRGFVRTDDDRYWALKDLMPGFGERFPWLPAGSYILSAADGVRARVLEACRRSGLTVRPLREYVELSE